MPFSSFTKALCLPFLSFTFAAQAAPITIEGTVTNGKGKPVEKCDVFFNKEKWITDESVHVQCDEDGRYTAQIDPGLYNSIYICDEEKYGKTALEFWGWNLNLTESQTLDAAFDTIEVYSLATWASNGGSNTIFASFRPMTLKKAEFYNVQSSDREIAIFDILPNIDASSIEGSIDNNPLELVHYNWVYEKTGGCQNAPETVNTENGCYMPMIVAQFKKPKLAAGQHTLKVRLTDTVNHEIGEGITHFVSNKSGLGF
ncbi:MAG: hypothetical protein AB3N28_04245 [Kordiimonas sp.]